MTSINAIRLNADIRDIICKSMLEHRFGPQRADLHKFEDQLIREVYEAAYDEKTRRQIKNLPDGALPRRKKFTVNVAGCQYVLEIRRSNAPWYPVFYRDKDFYDRFATFDALHPLGQRIADHVHDRGELVKLEETTQVSLTAALRRFSTIGKLLEGWPEVEPFIPKDLTAPATTRALVPIEHLNATLGLPIATEAANG